MAGWSFLLSLGITTFYTLCNNREMSRLSTFTVTTAKTYHTHLTMENHEDKPQPGEKRGPSRKSRLRRETKPNGSSTAILLASPVSARANNGASVSGSIVWTILLAGLVFSLLDLFYIAIYLERVSPTGPIDPSELIAVPSSNQHSKETPNVVPSQSSTTAATTTKTATTRGDKGPILQLLREAGIDINQLEPALMDSLPTWNEVSALYGSEPIMIGLETCDTFRSVGDPADHFLGVAGTMNTGTNLLAELLIANCHMGARMAKYGKTNRGIRWQVPWGKHTPVANETYRLSHKTAKDGNVDSTAIFPAVTIRDPAAWMHSMCRHEYAMEWPHDERHCPNLVPTATDAELDPTFLLDDHNSNIPIEIQYADFLQPHDSLIHHWNEWYTAYAQAPFPRVLVRFEDLIFHARAVTTAVCECAGGTLENRPFQFITGSAKHGQSHGAGRTGYVDAIVRYGSDRGRWRNMTQQDLAFTREHLDRDIMTTFGYHYPSSP